MDSQKEEKWIKHYSSHHKILLVGEGDFSFALCLAKAFGSASNIIATSLDSKDWFQLYLPLEHDELLARFIISEVPSGAYTTLSELEELGCTLVHEVDAKRMNTHPLLEMKLFDRIVFNFPHARLRASEDNPSQICRHQKLVLGFMKSARMMVSQDGEIHVTHKNAKPYCQWDIAKLGEEAVLSLAEKVRFKINEYPGYVNKRGSGLIMSYLSFHVGDSSTFKFCKASDVEPLILEMSECRIN